MQAPHAPRNGDVSWWWRALGGYPARRPSLPGPQEADVCIVGAGYTGLWTAYYLAGVRPDLRVVVLEAAFAGFGASGRNGGWVTAESVGSRDLYARGPSGPAGARALEAALRETVPEIGQVCAAESIGCDFAAGGRLSVATTPAQLARLRAGLEDARAWGDGADVVSFLPGPELAGRVRVAGALGALFWPHSARIQPAALVTGLAAAAERRGVVIYEATPVTEILPARPAGDTAGDRGGSAVARTVFGDVRARAVLRCTEGFTARLPGAHRVLLPMNSSMVVTEPLGDDAWQAIGWDGMETLADEAHAYIYAQRTADGRIAIGGRGVPYRYGSAVDDRGETSPATVEALRAVIGRLFPAAASAPLDHAWSGVLGVPRDWCAAVNYNRAAGLGWAGGYSGHGVLAANLAGRTLADLVAGEKSALTSLPWVGHRSRAWEPEPARWTGVHGLYALYRAADRLEGNPRSAARATAARLLGGIGDRISGIPH
ncbi:MAG TPA: FAD-dependent oxidoreductase [Trebonia sp.]|jgi:glycine/D-amino acid oxidase-like deaminating enzyme|nr:FAD-dependent oxidoreductase [Trebonia sp.]